MRRCRLSGGLGLKLAASASRLGAVTVSLLTLPGVALAHGAIPGMGAFYTGLLHPLRVAGHLLALTGLALFMGQRRLFVSRHTLLAFMGGLLSGLSVLLYGPAWVGPLAEKALLLLALGLGLAVATAHATPLRVNRWAIFLVAFAVIADSGQDGMASQQLFLANAGVVCGATMLVANIGSLVQWIRPAWALVGVRVVGSWVAAAALMVGALMFRASA